MTESHIHTEWYKRPIKAPNDIKKFSYYERWPKLGSLKMDGFRNVSVCGLANFTPNLKDQVNNGLRLHFKDFFDFLEKQQLVADGELWVPNLPFTQLSSKVRSQFGDLSGVGFYVFDLLTLDEWMCGSPTFMMRYQRLQAVFEVNNFKNVFMVPQMQVSSPNEAATFFDRAIDQGHEGLMLRSINGLYKHGRCSHKMEDLLKFKYYETHDAMIVGFEQMHRLTEDAEVRVSPDGLMERSHKAVDYTPAEYLGSFVVTADGGQSTFKVSPGKGFTWDDRADWWQRRNSLRGQWVEFAFMPHGTKDKPRHGRLIRFRDPK